MKSVGQRKINTWNNFATFVWIGLQDSGGLIVFKFAVSKIAEMFTIRRFLNHNFEVPFSWISSSIAMEM